MSLLASSYSSAISKRIKDLGSIKAFKREKIQACNGRNMKQLAVNTPLQESAESVAEAVLQAYDDVYTIMCKAKLC